MRKPVSVAAGQESEPEIGWYVYAFLARQETPAQTGVDGRAPLTLLAEDGIGALVSPVPLTEFGSEALGRNLGELRWLEEKVRRHAEIVEQALAGGPVLPMRFGTIFLDRERILGVIRKNAGTLRAAFDHLRDKEEWGVKGFSHPAAFRASLLRTDPALLALSREASASPPGRAFFLTKQLEALACAKTREQEVALAHQALGAIQGRVVELVLHEPPLVPATGGEEVRLNLACLVEKEGVGALLGEVERWNRSHAEDGFGLLASGPWPPYHFTPRLDCA